MKKNLSMFSIFMHADGLDLLLMGLGFIGAVGVGVTTPLLIILTNQFFNNVGVASISSPDMLMHNTNKIAMTLVYIASGTLVACFLEGYCWTRTGERQARRISAKYLKQVLRQDVGYFDLHVSSASQIISVSNDSLLIQDVLSEKVPDFLTKISTFIASYIVAFLLQWKLALVGFPFGFLLVIPGLIYGRTLMGLSRKNMEEYIKADLIVEQVVSSIRTVYAFVGENKSIKDFSTKLEGCVKLGLKQGLVKGFAIGSGGVVFAMWAVVTYYGSKLIMYGDAKGGTVFSVGSALGFGGMSLGAGLPHLKAFSEACSAGDRIMELVNRIPDIDSDSTEGEILATISGEIEFRHVGFAYPSRPDTVIFKDFDLKVLPGKTMALVGGSGSGKSTVISLLQRFYDPLEGDIVLDGISIGKMNVKWLRSQMGLVSQEPALFDTSVKENIMFGKEDATMEEILEASKASNVHDFITQLPLGYDTRVGDRGVLMSGGQKQRIAIARAIIKAPRILLLDEATSALDSESEHVVQEALDKAAVGRTTIVVAHRLSTVQNADNIAVFQDGHIIEIGSVEELMQNKHGVYTSLVRIQQPKPTTKQTYNPDPSSRPPKDPSSRPPEDPPSCPPEDPSSRPPEDPYKAHVDNASVVDDGSSTVKDESLEVKTFDQNINTVKVPSFKRLLAMNLPELRNGCLGCVAGALYGAVQPVYAVVMGWMISIYFSTDHDFIKANTKIICLFFMGLCLLTFVFNVLQHYSFGYMGENLTKRIRLKMLTKILSFEVGWFDQHENSSGAICSRINKDASVVRSLVGDQISLLVQTTSAVSVAWTMGLLISWRLAAVMIVVQPIAVLCFYSRHVLLKSMTAKAIKSQRESSILAAEAVYHHRTITSFSSQNRILKMLDRAQNASRKESIRQSFYAGIGLGTSESLLLCIIALDYWYGGKLLAQGRIDPKSLMQTLIILITTARVIADAGSMTMDLARGSNAVRSVFEIIDRTTRIDPNSLKGYQPESITGRVEFVEVDFVYPTRTDVTILRNFSMVIEAGKSVALVGPSGSGKSTIIGLIQRFYDPFNGTVKIDGRDIRSYNLRCLRKHVAVVSQEPTLFAGTIKENIKYGASDEIDETEIVLAAKAANAHDFISSLPEGYDTWCGDRGSQLSGGQKQRIAIARAVLRNPTVLLLDEATSALDGLSESVVQDALERVMVGRTTVVVAHRLSTVHKCEVIYVLDQGQIVESGTHLSLLDRRPTGVYFSLVNGQK